MRIVNERRSIALVALIAVLGMALASVQSTVPAGASATGTEGAGGKAVTHRSDGRPVNTPGLTRKAPSARMFRIGLNASEPTLGQTKNGDVFYTAFQTNTRVDIVRSSDQGKSWEIVSPKFGTRNAQLLSFDPYIWVDKYTDRIFTIDLTVACAYLSYSDDHGKTWITNPLACGRPVNDHQTLFSGPPAHSPMALYPNVVYYCWNDVGTSSCSKSLDGGLTFSATGSPAYPGVDPEGSGQGNPQCGGLHGHGHVGHDGTVYLPKGHCGQPWLSISKDEGATWTRVKVADIGVSTHEAGIATDKAGNIYYTWTAANRLPYLVVSKNGGKTWSDPMMIGPPGIEEANLPGIDVGGAGKVAIVYMGSENSPGVMSGGDEDDGGECTAVGACPTSDAYKNVTWNGYMTVSDNALDKDPVFYTGTVNDKSDPLIRHECGPGRCGAVYDFIDIVVGSDGTPWAAFVDACTAICGQGGDSNMGSDGVVGRLVGGPNLK